MHPPAFGLKEKIIVVTGAGSGIGRGIALAAAAEGARVAVLDLNQEGAAETARLAVEKGGAAMALRCDVSSEASVAAAAEAVRAQWGEADMLVNNAGMIRPGPLDSLPLSEWNLLLSVNLTGAFICAQIFGRPMRARGRGALVHVSSIAAEHATPNSGAYSVAKAGLTMLSRQLAVEWGPAGVRSNAVHPGLIYTPLSAGMYDRPGVTEARSGAIPSGRIGKPDDIAQAVLFLASDRADYVNGQEITVDGGFTANLLNLIPRAGYDAAR